MFINFATGWTLPPFWLNHPVHVWKRDILPSDISNPNAMEEYNKMLADKAMQIPHQCPLRLRLKNSPNKTLWTLPFDPVISVSGGNKIIRTDVLKQDNSNNERRGTIKEVWSQDDYEIQIAGLFIGENDDDMPLVELDKLRALCEAREVLYVECDLLDVFNIKYIAVEKFDFAHTPGRMNQQFSIKAYSDDDFSLLAK